MNITVAEYLLSRNINWWEHISRNTAGLKSLGSIIQQVWQTDFIDAICSDSVHSRAILAAHLNL